MFSNIHHPVILDFPLIGNISNNLTLKTFVTRLYPCPLPKIQNSSCETLSKYCLTKQLIWNVLQCVKMNLNSVRAPVLYRNYIVLHAYNFVIFKFSRSPIFHFKRPITVCNRVVIIHLEAYVTTLSFYILHLIESLAKKKLLMYTSAYYAAVVCWKLCLESLLLPLLLQHLHFFLVTFNLCYYKCGSRQNVLHHPSLFILVSAESLVFFMKKTLWTGLGTETIWNTSFPSN